MLELVENLNFELRLICNNLRPPSLSDLGLLCAIELMCQEIMQKELVLISLETVGVSRNERFKEEVELTAYRFLEEGITNAVKHSGLIDKIKEVKPAVKILMLTGQNPQGYVTKSISKGANGFILKECSVKEMIAAILQVSRNEFYFSQNMAPYLQSAIVGVEIRTNNNIELEGIHGTLLTPREIEIMELIAQGLRNIEIAITLGIKNRTVECHVSNILPKLAVKSRLEAVLIYMKGKDESGGRIS